MDITDETFLDYSEYTGKDKDLSIDDGTCAEQVTPSMKEYNAVRIDKTKKLKKIVMERTLTVRDFFIFFYGLYNVIHYFLKLKIIDRK